MFSRSVLVKYIISSDRFAAAIPVATQAKFYNIPLISWAAADSTLSNSTRFPTFARTVSTWGE
jgi:hypothetical protein